MAQPDRSAPRHPQRRSDSARPASTHSRTRRGGDRRPYPTAPTTTRISPAKPGSPSARARTRGSASTPTPATVWTAGPTPTDLDATWPTPIVAKIVTSFSAPGARVVLLPWPTSQPVAADTPRLALASADGVIDHAPGTEPDGELADALTTIEDLDRTGHVVRIPVGVSVTGPGSRPFWADLVSDRNHSRTIVEQPPHAGPDGGSLAGVATGPADIDLVITSLRPQHGGDAASDLVALFAARRLRTGGILAVLTHCDWSGGELTDPTGPMVAAGQNADLLYLQHIVALHTPLTDGRFAATADGRATASHRRAEQRAAAHGLPAPHRRIHSDVLVLAQPHDHQPPRSVLGERARDTGCIR